MNAAIIPSNQYALWGIAESKIIIPVGGVITEAVLTITAVKPANASFYVYLLDNVKTGYKTDFKAETGELLDSHGIPLSGTYVIGNYVCRFSLNNNQTGIRKMFPAPTSIKLADSTVSLSSALLELMDYAGNGNGFGIGIEPVNTTNLQITGLKLTMVIKSFLSPGSSMLTVSYDLTPPPGDVNQDMKIDLNDFTALNQNWLASNCQAPDYCSGCDINKSGVVDFDDLSILIQNWLNQV